MDVCRPTDEVATLKIEELVDTDEDKDRRFDTVDWLIEELPATDEIEPVDCCDITERLEGATMLLNCWLDDTEGLLLELEVDSTLLPTLTLEEVSV